MKARPDCCEEASPFTHEYTPCNKVAVRMVKTNDPTPYRMCAECADYNVTNRGAKDLGPYSHVPLTAEEKIRLIRDFIGEYDLDTNYWYGADVVERIREIIK